MSYVTHIETHHEVKLYLQSIRRVQPVGRQICVFVQEAPQNQLQSPHHTLGFGVLLTLSRMFLELFFSSCVLPCFTSHIFVIFPSCDWLPCPDQPHLFLLNCPFLVYVVVLTDLPSFQPVPLHFLGFTFYICPCLD